MSGPKRGLPTVAEADQSSTWFLKAQRNPNKHADIRLVSMGYDVKLSIVISVHSVRNQAMCTASMIECICQIASLR